MTASTFCPISTAIQHMQDQKYLQCDLRRCRSTTSAILERLVQSGTTTLSRRLRCSRISPSASCVCRTRTTRATPRALLTVPRRLGPGLACQKRVSCFATSTHRTRFCRMCLPSGCACCMQFRAACCGCSTRTTARRPICLVQRSAPALQPSACDWQPPFHRSITWRATLQPTYSLTLSPMAVTRRPVLTCALRLARNPKELAAIRARLAVNRRTQSLFDMARYARDFQDRLLHIAHEHAQGQRG